MTESTGSKLKWLWLAVLVIAIDLGTKAIATAMLTYGNPVPVLPSFNLTLLHNTGAAFSFLADAAGWQRWFFTIISAGVSVMLLVWLARLPRGSVWLPIALTLILGGAVGNLIDRVLYGHVVDFISFHWNNSYFPAFNIADSAITLGAIMMALDVVREIKEERAKA